MSEVTIRKIDKGDYEAVKNGQVVASIRYEPTGYFARSWWVKFRDNLSCDVHRDTLREASDHVRDIVGVSV